MPVSEPRHLGPWMAEDVWEVQNSSLSFSHCFSLVCVHEISHVCKKKEGKKRVLPFSPFLFRGQRNQCVSQKPLALIIAHGALDHRTVWSLVSRGKWTSGRKEIPVLLVHTGRASTSSPAWPLCSWANTEGFY